MLEKRQVKAARRGPGAHQKKMIEISTGMQAVKLSTVMTMSKVVKGFCRVVKVRASSSGNSGGETDEVRVLAALREIPDPPGEHGQMVRAREDDEGEETDEVGVVEVPDAVGHPCEEDEAMERSSGPRYSVTGREGQRTHKGSDDPFEGRICR